MTVSAVKLQLQRKARHDSLVKSNQEFMKRIERHRLYTRLRMPDYIAERLEREPGIETPRSTGHKLSKRAQIASRIVFSFELRNRATSRQLRAYALLLADQLIAAERKTERA